ELEERRRGERKRAATLSLKGELAGTPPKPSSEP
ncbi:MAG: hypothetical protein PWQ34_1854, partial [Caldanaerobacter sp.]|nr:hypothetical protein [Caldanaerobacter sp.]